MNDNTADGRNGLVVTWPKVAALAVSLILGLGAGIGYLSQLLLASYDARLTQIHEDAEGGFDSAEQADRDIRQYVESTNQTLRDEFSSLRQEVSRLADRVVEANVEVGKQVGQLRLDLVGVIEKGDARLEGRFDRLEHRMDEMLKRISYEQVIPVPEGSLVVDGKGNLLGPKGDFIGTLPAVIKLDPGSIKP